MIFYLLAHIAKTQLKVNSHPLCDTHSTCRSVITRCIACKNSFLTIFKNINLDIPLKQFRFTTYENVLFKIQELVVFPKMGL